MKIKLFLVCIMLAGLALRIWGIDFGLPYQFHQDEPIIVNHALAYGTGDFNPHFFIIPPLTSYILFIFYAIFFLIGNATMMFNGAESFAISFFKDPTYFYLIGRTVTGFLPSLLAIYLTYRMALKFFSRKVALYSSLVMSVSFLNVINAHYIYTDNLLVLFVLLAYIAMPALIENSTLIRYILSGVFIGIAIATKYNAALLIVPFLLAHLIACKRGIKNMLFDTKLLIFLGAVVLSFIICNPYSVLDWRFFLLSVTKRIRHGYMGWSHHIIYSMFEGLGVMPTLLGIAGLSVLLLRRFKEAIFIISFPIFYYLHLVFASQSFSRYALALIPFFAIGTGFLLFDYFYPKCKTQARRFIIVAISFFIIMPTLVKSIKADILFAGEDTRVAAARWIEENIPPHTKIAFDHVFFKPPIKQTMAQLKEKQAIVGRQPELQQLKSKKLNFQIEAFQGGKTYEIYYLVKGDEDIGQFLNFWPVIRNNLNELRRSRIEYIAFNNMTISEDMHKLHKEIAKRHKPAAIFSPYKDRGFRRPYDKVAITCIPVKTKELFSRQRPGPHITVYKLK